MVAGTRIGSQQIGTERHPAEIRKATRSQFRTMRNLGWCAKNLAWVVKFSQGLQNFGNPHAKSVGLTSNDHNFLIRTPIRTFLDSIESPLSLKSIHI